jgi:hypothetical protein
VTEATLWSWVLRLTKDVRATDRQFPFVTYRIELDGRRVARNHGPLLPQEGDMTPSAYLERMRRRTRHAVTLVLDGMSTTTWDLVEATLPMIRPLRPPYGRLALQLVVRDGTAPASRDPIALGDDQLGLRFQIGPSSPFDPARALRKLLEEDCMSSVRESERMEAGADFAIARLRLRLSDQAALDARIEAHRLCWETGYGLERTPPLKNSTVPDGALLTTKFPEAIATSFVGNCMVLASWGNSFEVSPVAPWMGRFVDAARSADGATVESLSADVPSDDRGIARDLVDALWSANAFEVRAVA